MPTKHRTTIDWQVDDEAVLYYDSPDEYYVATVIGVARDKITVRYHYDDMEECISRDSRRILGRSGWIKRLKKQLKPKAAKKLLEDSGGVLQRTKARGTDYSGARRVAPPHRLASPLPRLWHRNVKGVCMGRRGGQTYLTGDRSCGRGARSFALHAQFNNFHLPRRTCILWANSCQSRSGHGSRAPQSIQVYKGHSDSESGGRFGRVSVCRIQS